MSEKKIVYPTDRKEWRGWLEANFEKENEIWLVFPNKASGETGVSYNDAVEEALCYGWIDGRIKETEPSCRKENHRLNRW